MTVLRRRHSPAYVRSGITLIEVVVCVAIVALLLGVLLPTISHARESGRRSACLGSLAQLGVAVASYTMTHKQFPAAEVVSDIPLNGVVQLRAFGDWTSGQSLPAWFRCPTAASQLPRDATGPTRSSYAFSPALLVPSGTVDDWHRPPGPDEPAFPSQEVLRLFESPPHGPPAPVYTDWGPVHTSVWRSDPDPAARVYRGKNGVNLDGSARALDRE